MKYVMRSKTAPVVTFSFLTIFLASMLYAHCQIPCAIYDDPARIKMMAEHITTIEKAMNQIQRLSAEDGTNYNQIVRWVNNKDQHADELNEIVTYYFMAQRVKPVDEDDSDAYKDYIAQLTTLHKMQVTAMKCKQTTDLENVAKLQNLLSAFQKMYIKTP